jgi:hypothetical protein
LARRGAGARHSIEFKPKSSTEGENVRQNPLDSPLATAFARPFVSRISRTFICILEFIWINLPDKISNRYGTIDATRLALDHDRWTGR